MKNVLTALLALLGASNARALGVTDRVKLNEVNYAPAENPEDPFEFIELYNAGTTTAYLDGAVLSDEGSNGTTESSFRFPGISGGNTIPLAPGAYMLLAGDATGSAYAGIDYEFYAGSGDTDDLTVPNLIKTSGLASELFLGNLGDGVTLSTGVTTGSIIPCSEVEDGMSYLGGGAGDVYAMSPSVCADPATGPATGKSNLSLQRCPDGTDTENSAADFHVAIRTPRGPNCASPKIARLDYSPCVPVTGQQVTVTAIVKDADHNVSSVRLFYELQGAAAFDSLNMTAANDTTYSGHVPGQATQARALYYAVARDAAGNVEKAPVTAPTLAYDYRVGMTAISLVQSLVAPDSCSTSIYVGQAVNLAGTVTHVAHEFSDTYFYIQNGKTLYSGMRVDVPDGSFVPNLGDSVVVSGSIVELLCQTELRLFSGCANVASTGRKVRARQITTLADIRREETESMLVKISGPLTVATGFDTTKVGQNVSFEFRVGTGSDSAWVGDDTFSPDGVGYHYLAHPGDKLDALTGIAGARRPTTYDHTTRLRFEPRRDNDVDRDYTDAPDRQLDVVRAFELRQNQPNPFNPITTIEFALAEGGAARLDVYDAGGRRVRQLLARTYPATTRVRVPWDGRDAHGQVVPSGLYFYKLVAGAGSATRKMLLVK